MIVPLGFTIVHQSRTNESITALFMYQPGSAVNVHLFILHSYAWRDLYRQVGFVPIFSKYQIAFTHEMRLPHVPCISHFYI